MTLWAAEGWARKTWPRKDKAKAQTEVIDHLHLFKTYALSAGSYSLCPAPRPHHQDVQQRAPPWTLNPKTWIVFNKNTKCQQWTLQFKNSQFASFSWISFNVSRIPVHFFLARPCCFPCSSALSCSAQSHNILLVSPAPPPSVLYSISLYIFSLSSPALFPLWSLSISISPLLEPFLPVSSWMSCPLLKLSTHYTWLPFLCTFTLILLSAFDLESGLHATFLKLCACRVHVTCYELL